MPDFISVVNRHRKLVLLFPLLAALAAFLFSLAMPKLYKSTTTALPANSALTDRARLFSNSIETLYPELGSADELDRIEGTAQLDTLYLAVAAEQGLTSHYKTSYSTDPLYEAALRLKKKTKVERSAYGELKITVWDVAPQKAALLANALLDQLNRMHKQVRLLNYLTITTQLENELANTKRRLALLGKSKSFSQLGNKEQQPTESGAANDTIRPYTQPLESMADVQALSEQRQQYTQLLNEFRVTISASPHILLPVERARPGLKLDKPNSAQLVLFALFAGLLLALLTAFFIESRKQ